MKNQTNLMIGLIAQTSIHAGAGSSAGAVDLPIQREGHNGWPCIFGSSVKGALRTKAEQVLTASDGKRDDATLNTVFGPDTQNASDHAGAISVGDARLLLLPVRSLTSAFKWVTCPAALDRFKRDSEMLGKKIDFDMPVVPKNDTSEFALCTSGTNLFLEEYRFTVDASANLDSVINALCELVKRNGFAETLNEQLAIVSDNMFAHLARSATPINAHIAINSESKTVNKGALWYEETLPPETVLYIPIMAQKSRNKDKPIDASAIAACVSSILTTSSWLQLGGNETVGMGWCAVHVETIGGR
jgi:CRISPR-associated protein Cmr4